MNRKLFWTWCLLACGMKFGGHLHAEEFRKALISAENNLRVEEWRLAHSDFDWETGAQWSIRKRVLHGGKQEGVDVVEVNNGRLSFVVIPTRGMSVYEARLGDVRLGWDSPVKEIVHPRHINLQSRGGLGWLEGFNEWMVRCGLEFAGHPGQDRFVNNVGEEATMDLTLHGKVGNIPASEVEVVIDDEPPHRIRVRGRVDERMFYGPQLEVWTEISTTPGAAAFRIHDSITNRAAQEQEFQIIYHANFGPPLLEEGTKLVAAAREVSPMNAHAARAVNAYATYRGPTPGFIEEVYCIRPWSDAEGNTAAMLRNAAGDRGVALTFSTRELPYLTQWKNTAPRAAGYVTGIEPGTGFPYNRRVERHFGRVPKLQPGETRGFTIDFEILDNETAVQRLTQKIDAIQADRPTTLKSEPEADLTLFE